MTTKCHRVVVSIILLLRQHSTQPLLGGICLQEEWSVKAGEHQHGADWILSFNILTASCTLGGNCNGPILTFFPSTSYRGLTMWANPLMKHLYCPASLQNVWTWLKVSGIGNYSTAHTFSLLGWIPSQET